MTEAQAQELIQYFIEQKESTTGGMVLMALTIAIVIGFWIYAVIADIKKSKQRKAWLNSLPKEQQNLIDQYNKLK